MKVYLAVFLKFMDYEANRIDLKKFKSIKELDEYTTHFKNSDEIKKRFSRDIQEFLLDSRKNKAYRETKKGIPKTYLSAYYIEDNEIKFVKICYRDSEDVIYLEPAEFFEKLEYVIIDTKTAFENSGILSSYDLDKYLKNMSIFKLKYSGEELSYLRRYISGFDTDDYLRNFLSLVRRRFYKMPYEEREKYLRFSLNELKEIDMVNSNTGIIETVDEVIEPHIPLRDRYVDDCNDEMFMQLVDNERYEELFNNYEIDKILKYSKSMKYPLGLRRK